MIEKFWEKRENDQKEKALNYIRNMASTRTY